MSTKMYAYRLPKAALWHTLDQIRAFYAAEHPVAVTLLRLFEEARAGQGANLPVAFFDLVDRATERSDRDWTVQLQLFDDGDSWVVRPLELGWRFFSEHARWPDLEPVFYDNRSDVPPEQEANEAVARWIDDAIQARHYLTVAVFDQETLQDLAWQHFYAAIEAKGVASGDA